MNCKIERRLLDDVIFLIQYTFLHFRCVVLLLVLNYDTSGVRKKISNKIVRGTEQKGEPIFEAKSGGLAKIAFFKQRAIEQILLSSMIFALVYHIFLVVF